jgi:protein-(glutamine-N5) methyltransferase, release factor-specific
VPTFKEALKSAQKELAEVEVYEQSAQLLMLELADQQASDLYSNYETAMPDDLYHSFIVGIERLKMHEPLQHILGYHWFYGRKFSVNEDVLIPRYETEELVANVLMEIDEHFPNNEVKIVDIGTGSGAIAISLALEEPRVCMYASDISEKALTIAQVNAQALDANISFIQGDMLEPLIVSKIKVDVLVSNPPYIPKNQNIETSVKNFEPSIALFGGEDGLHFYRKILKGAHKVINDKSILAFEIGFDEKEAILSLADEYFPNDRKEVLKDINNKDRMLFIYHGC